LRGRRGFWSRGDCAAGRAVLRQRRRHPCALGHRRRPPPHHQAWADSGYRTKVVEHGARLGIDVEVTRRDPAQKGFKVIPRRWVVERTFGWLMHHRRLARDYETHPHHSEAMIKVAMVDLISRRLTRESTPTWRDA
jgi:transposase